ncbi:lantibiotic dehydratase [Paenibacillus sp. FSL H7-0442]|uniref:lantibiotic dehydratase n=1 Tax=Paenibacillus sp. FSL H7-0442 TaxID=2921435 RepID=UPI0031596684
MDKVTNINMFQSLDFFMVRVPLLPIDFYYNLFSESTTYDVTRNKALSLLTDPVIREAITIASPSLMNSINNVLTNKNTKKMNTVLRAVVNYLIRLSSRATPYGVFSGVSIGLFSELSCLEVGDTRQNRKISRPDMEWIMGLVRYLEKEGNVVKQLAVRTNPSLYLSGTRIKLPFLNYIEQHHDPDVKRMKSSSIKVSKPVQLVMDYAQTPIPFANLVKKIQEEYPENKETLITEFLMKLLNQEFLISNLRPPLCIDNMDLPFEYLRKQIAPINNIEYIKKGLDEISEEIKQYDDSPIGKGESLYNQLCIRMRKLVPTKETLQIDMETKVEEAFLSQNVSKDIARSAEILWRLSPDLSNPHWTQYRNDFIEKYGIDCQVPILELLDEDLGLGAPPDYKYPESRYSLEHPILNAEREKVLANWITNVIKEGKIEIELTDKKLKRIETLSDELLPPTSIEMYVTIAANSEEALKNNEYKIIINPNSGSAGAGKTFGRFGPILDKTAREKITNTYKIQEEYRKDAIFAELVYLTVNSRHSNVVITNKSCSHQIVLGTNYSNVDTSKQISISDLYVGCTYNYFYLKSQSLNKEIIPVSTNMLNYNNAPNVYRFLMEISQERHRSILPFQWGGLSEFPMLPRVKYKNIILSLAKWSLNKNNDELKKCKKEEDWIEGFEKWRGEWRVPRYVYITTSVSDNRALIDLKNEFFILELFEKYHKLSDSQSLWLTESGFEPSDVWARGKEGRFIAEYVIPLVRTNVEEPLTPKQCEDMNLIQRPIREHSNIIYLPGSEWLYIKLYGMSEREEEFIGNYIRTFCEQVENQGIINRYFIVRYKDPDHHIRLRLHGEESVVCKQLIPAIHMWARRLKAEGLLSKIIFDSYEPEIERYGGKRLISIAERFFAVDSKITVELVSLKYNNKLNVPIEIIGFISVIDILNQFIPAVERQVTWFHEEEWHKEHVKDFMKDRTFYIILCDVSDNWSSLRNLEYGDYFLSKFQERKKIINEYKEALEHEKDLTNTFSNILGSLIHMHLNRLIGTNRKVERKIMSLLSHSLYHFNESIKHKKKCISKELNVDDSSTKQ